MGVGRGGEGGAPFESKTKEDCSDSANLCQGMIHYLSFLKQNGSITRKWRNPDL